MRVLIVGGLGKMGQEVAKICEESGYDVVGKIDKNDDIFQIENADVIVDFSTCDDRTDYVEYARKKKIAYCCFSTLVSASDLKKMKGLAKVCPVLMCPNASRGINAILDMLKVCAQQLVGADVVVCEYHHKQKKDAPSGTAKTILNFLLPTFNDAKVVSYRVGNERGTHKIEFYLDDEKIEITHQVASRRVFAIGAIEMAKRTMLLPAGFYTKI